MTTLKQYQLVRVKCSLRSPSDYDGWRINIRAPALGDIGTVVDILQADGLPDRFVVECCQGDGQSVWLADFDAEELEHCDQEQNEETNLVHLVFLRSDRLLLVKRPDADWRQLQEQFPDYMTSLGPWTADEIGSYFEVEYTADDTNWPFSRHQIDEFFASSDSVELSTQ